MPQFKQRQFLDFEKPIKEVYDQLSQLREMAEKNQKVDYTDAINQLEISLIEKRKEITNNLTPWQRVQLSRHPDRPYTNAYIKRMCNNYIEFFGDRNVKDDKAIVGGFAQIDGQTVMLVGHQGSIPKCDSYAILVWQILKAIGKHLD